MLQQDPNNYWEQLERLEKLIRASELKAGILFSFHSLILGVFVDRLESFKYIFDENIIFIVFLFIWILFVLISVFFCFKCFRPRIEMKYDDNVFFFKDAVSKFGSVEQYTEKLLQVCGSEELLYTQLSQQIHAESKIINQKFKCVSSSIKYFGLSFIIVIITIILWTIMH